MLFYLSQKQVGYGQLSAKLVVQIMVNAVAGTVLRKPSGLMIFVVLLSFRSVIAIFFNSSLRGVNVCFFIKTMFGVL